MQEAGIAAVTTIDDLCQKSDRASSIFLVLEIKKQKTNKLRFPIVTGACDSLKTWLFAAMRQSGYIKHPTTVCYSILTFRSPPFLRFSSGLENQESCLFVRERESASLSREPEFSVNIVWSSSGRICSEKHLCNLSSFLGTNL